jgi:hypothetical protein
MADGRHARRLTEGQSKEDGRRKLGERLERDAGPSGSRRSSQRRAFLFPSHCCPPLSFLPSSRLMTHACRRRSSPTFFFRESNFSRSLIRQQSTLSLSSSLPLSMLQQKKTWIPVASGHPLSTLRSSLLDNSQGRWRYMASNARSDAISSADAGPATLSSELEPALLGWHSDKRSPPSICFRF